MNGAIVSRVLLETHQDVPEFLQHFKREGGALIFDEEEDPDTGGLEQVPTTVMLGRW
jgi:hypothetical protein